MKKFKMKDLAYAKELTVIEKKAHKERLLAISKLRELGLNDNMINFLGNKPGAEIVEFSVDKISYLTTESITPTCDWYQNEETRVIPQPNGKILVEMTFR